MADLISQLIHLYSNVISHTAEILVVALESTFQLASAGLSSLASIAEALSDSPTFILESFMYALIGGLFPALIWLWFWMHENHEHHESKQTIWLTFMCGMCAVLLVFPLQKFTQWWIGGAADSSGVVFAWAFLEEGLKFTVAYLIALRDKEGIFDEPIDAFVYLMTASLGFAALENTLYILGPLLQGEALNSVFVGNMRYMGANLLHVASSGLLSLFVAYTYFKPMWIQRFSIFAGIAAATLFHGGFNFLLISIDKHDLGKEKIFLAFSFVWMSLIILILALEKVKKLKNF